MVGKEVEEKEVEEKEGYSGVMRWRTDEGGEGGSRCRGEEMLG